MKLHRKPVLWPLLVAGFLELGIAAWSLYKGDVTGALGIMPYVVMIIGWVFQSIENSRLRNSIMDLQQDNIDRIRERGFYDRP